MKTPPFLHSSYQIRIISPSGSINPEYIDGAKNVLTGWGLEVTEGNYTRAEYGRFAGTPDQRASDLQQALDDPNVKAILCSRGGYGLAQIIDRLDFTGILNSPKWLIGFSDVTILHAVLSNYSIPSIHGMMTKLLSELPSNSEPTEMLRKMLFGELPAYHLPPGESNRTGITKGRLVGGNLSVLMGLRGSQYELKTKNCILFIEDIAEKPYQIDRMVQNLRFSGALSHLSGLIVGQFSDCEEDLLMMQTIQEIILQAVNDYDYPVCFDFPAGHVDNNLPLIFGEKVHLKVTPLGVELCF